MKLRLLTAAVSSFLLCNPALADPRPDPVVLHRDVCIIGGGSAGTYTATRLQQMGKSVALIEREQQLGGSVNSFRDPRTNTTFDYGVVIFSNNSLVLDYFGHLDVPAKPFTGFVPNGTNVYVNLATGATVAPLNATAFPDALVRYRTQVEKYPYLSTGWHLEYPIPEDLLLPFGDFLQKYDLGVIAPSLLASIGGLGNLLAQPTLYIMKQFSLDMVHRTLTNSIITSAANDNQALYDSALNRLGRHENAFVSSRVTRVQREQHNSTTIHITTPTGKKTIHASKLVIAIPPKLEILDPFLDLSDNEYTYLSQFNNSHIWANVVANSGIPQTATLSNVNPAAAIGIPAMPAVFGTAPTTVKDLHVAWYGSAYDIPKSRVKWNIEGQFDGWTGRQGNASAEVIALKDHSPYLVVPPLEAAKAGFYDGLVGLQGQLGTYWTGAAWQSHDSSAIWNFAEHEVLPMIVASLGGSSNASSIRAGYMC
ncbi:hypothetical protein M409DRAFT_48868 [Zasmidium cellare ATCC 36951]|uniref:Amine oxidase domain-containing protein n=1 Tax=Zasmidium cellare ATCC 36951 TaxID=1080233 RepID=A0A6A6D4H7_ZASCE|nr:uncharacterized protein M409DRAFT_48868 [Zasmidium cellare ATCC 36951]KAF2173965.1 hypothetical protein M409DRAFT_48868 [Zasmidium cellare ATCC 36951]